MVLDSILPTSPNRGPACRLRPHKLAMILSGEDGDAGARFNSTFALSGHRQVPGEAHSCQHRYRATTWCSLCSAMAKSASGSRGGNPAQTRPNVLPDSRSRVAVTLLVLVPQQPLVASAQEESVTRPKRSPNMTMSMVRGLACCWNYLLRSIASVRTTTTMPRFKHITSVHFGASLKTGCPEVLSEVA